MDERDRQDDPDDVTLWAGRLRAWPPAEPDAPAEADDRTRVRRRSGPVPDSDRAVPDTTVADATVLRRPGPAAQPQPEPEPMAEATEVRPTRRRPDPAAPARSEPPGRARVPAPEAREIYRPRAPEPVIVPRRTAAPPPSRPLAETAPVRTRRTGPLLLVAGGAVVAVAGVIAVLLLALG